MLALKIIDIKDFMNKLLIQDTFDQFEMIESSITTFNTFSIDGKLHTDFFDSDYQNSLKEANCNYSLWKDLKPYCFSIIRGKRTPVQFKFIFQLPSRQTAAFLFQQNCSISPDSVGGLFLNIHYKNKELYCTTGIGFRTFVADSSVKIIWDSYVSSFLRKHNIAFEQL